MPEWVETMISEIASDTPRAISIGPFGSSLKADLYTPTGVRVVRGQNIADSSRLDESDVVFVSPETAARFPGSLALEGDLVFPHRGAIGRVGIVQGDPWLLSSSMMKLRCDPAKVDPRYVFYFFRGPGKRELLDRASTVGTPGIGQPLRSLRQIPIKFPAIEAQQAIAEVLGALDDKIVANIKLVDVQLAVVNTEFLRRFGDRSLGVKVGTLADVVDCLHTKKPERMPDGRTLMQLNNIRDDGLVDRTSAYCVSPEDYVQWSRRFETRAWDLVITNVGRIGAVARIPDGYVAALGRNMTGIRPKNAVESGSFLIAALLSGAVRREIDKRTDAGSVMNALNVRSVPILRLQDSSVFERAAYHQFATPIFQNADTALSENATLANIRDTLLPQLMSGKLRVRDAERTVREVL